MRELQGEMLRPGRDVFIQKVGRMHIGIDSVNSASAETILMSMFRLIEFFQHTFVQQFGDPGFCILSARKAGPVMLGFIESVM